jgi:hypothetical protein
VGLKSLKNPYLTNVYPNNNKKKKNNNNKKKNNNKKNKNNNNKVKSKPLELYELASESNNYISFGDVVRNTAVRETCNLTIFF